jgi:hypothetical protein
MLVAEEVELLTLSLQQQVVQVVAVQVEQVRQEMALQGLPI